MPLVERLVAARRWRVMRELTILLGPDIPREVVIGPGLVLQHRARGAVIHPETVLGERVTLYHHVTIGRADAHVPRAQSPMVRIEVGDDVILYPGCMVLGGSGVTRVGAGTIIAANAVLTSSTGENEIWAGVPARRIGTR